MEKKLAILVADLAGYTALTETHGSSAAAHIVDRYLQLVMRSLRGSSRLIECVGDEVVILADTAFDLAETALCLHKLAGEEENFLAIHTGLHVGNLLERNTSYFGTAINLASRIASYSKGGQILCSNAFVKEIENDSTIRYTCLGELSFKNLRTKVEIYEISCKSQEVAQQIDPVCRMTVLPHQAIQWFYDGKMHYFCSDECQMLFASSPKDFASQHTDEAMDR